MKLLPEQTSWAFLSDEIKPRKHDPAWYYSIKYLDSHPVSPKALVNAQPMPEFVDLYFS